MPRWGVSNGTRQNLKCLLAYKNLKHIFKIIIYLYFDTSKCATNYVICKCILVLKKFQVLCQKSLVESRYHKLMDKRYCLYPPAYLVQRHLCFIEGVSLPLEARKGFWAERNWPRFHHTRLNGIDSTEIEALWGGYWVNNVQNLVHVFKEWPLSHDGDRN